MAARHDSRVLVVDDSPVYRHLITQHLREWEFEATTASSGLEAWKILQSPRGPTLVLLDWVMPDMDGLELCRKVRERSSADSYAYMILLTGKDGRGDLVRAMNAGADDYLVKPFDEQELKARLLVGTRILGLHQELVEAREGDAFFCHPRWINRAGEPDRDCQNVAPRVGTRAPGKEGADSHHGRH